MPTERRRVALFYALTLALLAAIPMLHGLLASGPMDFAAAGARASAQTGLAWTSNLLVMLRLCAAEPVLWLVVFGSAVPSLAALLVVARQPSAVRALLARLAPASMGSPSLRTTSSRRRCPSRWFAVGILLVAGKALGVRCAKAA
jgi:hypothetical protein